MISAFQYNSLVFYFHFVKLNIIDIIFLIVVAYF